MGIYPILADLKYFNEKELNIYGTPDGILEYMAIKVFLELTRHQVLYHKRQV